MKSYGKLTPEVRQRILDGLSAGQTVTAVAALAKVHRTAVYWWLDRGRESPRSKFGEFLRAFEAARARAEVPLVQAVRRCAIGGEWRVPCYDENGDQMVDEATGQPKFRTITLLPDGHLALRLLAVCGPRDWGGQGAPNASEGGGRPELPPGTIINLFLDSFQILVDHGIKVPAEMVAKLSGPATPSV